MLDFEQGSVRDAEDRLAALRKQRREGFAGALLLPMLAAAAFFYLPFEVPVGFMAGTLAAVGLIAIATDRRRQLMAELIQRHEAYCLEPVARAGTRFASPARRERLAAWLRDIVRTADQCEVSSSYTTLAIEERVLCRRRQLLDLAAALETPDLSLHPAGVAITHRMLTRPGISPLYNPGLPERTLDDTLRRIERCIQTAPR